MMPYCLHDTIPGSYILSAGKFDIPQTQEFETATNKEPEKIKAGWACSGLPGIVRMPSDVLAEDASCASAGVADRQVWTDIDRLRAFQRAR